MDATQLQHVRAFWQQVLQDALPDETKVRVGAVGFDGENVQATVNLRGARIAIGFAVPEEDANSAMSVAYAFDQAVGAAGYAGNVKVSLPAGEILPPSVDADGNIPAVNDPPADPAAQAEADAKAELAEAEYAEAPTGGDLIDEVPHPSAAVMAMLGDVESPAIIDTADAEETPRRRRKS